MKKIPNIADLRASRSNPNKSLPVSAADLYSVIREMKCEERRHMKHTRRMTELAIRAAAEERVIHRILDKSIGKTDPPKGPHLTVVK